MKKSWFSLRLVIFFGKVFFSVGEYVVQFWQYCLVVGGIYEFYFNLLCVFVYDNEKVFICVDRFLENYSYFFLGFIFVVIFVVVCVYLLVLLFDMGGSIEYVFLLFGLNLEIIIFYLYVDLLKI